MEAGELGVQGHLPSKVQASMGYGSSCLNTNSSLGDIMNIGEGWEIVPMLPVFSSESRHSNEDRRAVPRRHFVFEKCCFLFNVFSQRFCS